MQLHITTHTEDPDQPLAVDVIAEAIGQWLTGSSVEADLLHRNDLVGLDLKVKYRKHLTSPLTFLYELAKEHKVEFEVAMLEDAEPEPVCYFGYEEGSPDAFEVASYLGLEK